MSTKCFPLLWLLLPILAAAEGNWAAWNLDLQGHAPPVQFVVSVESPTKAPVPPPLEVPWASCQTVPGKQHCAEVGCPPVGTYRFWVIAQYPEGDSARSNIATCAVIGGQCACATHGDPPPVVSAPPARAAPPQPPPQAPMVLSQTIPPLHPVGTLPTAPNIPAIPASGGG